MPSTSSVPWYSRLPCCMSFESLNQLSATTLGGGSTKPRRAKAASRPSSIWRAQQSLSRHGAPGPTGSGRRIAKSTGTIKRPSPTTTRSNSPSMPDNTRFCWPLHHLPTNPNCAPYFWNTASSQTQVHCQRLWVAGLMSRTWRQIGANISSPKRRSRLSQERLGSTPSRREGQCLSQPRTRQSSEGVRQPKSAGNITPMILPSSFCWLRRRPSISATRFAGRPRRLSEK